jgi:hypothetical protein
MSLNRFSVFLWVLFLCLGPLTWATPHYFPDLSTDEKRLDWLLTMRGSVPQLFGQASKYDIDLMEMLADQERLQELLKNDPEYLKAFQERHPHWLKITLALKKQEMLTKTHLNPDALPKWKENLTNTFNSLPKDKTTSASLLDEILSLSQWIKERNSVGLETGLVQSLGAEDRKAFFAANPENRLQILKNKLPNQIHSNFKATAYGLKESPNKSDALALLEKLRSSESRLSDLTQLHLILQNAEGKIQGDHLARLNALKLKDLDFFTDSHHLSAKIKHLGKDFNKSHVPNVQPFVIQSKVLEERLSSGMTLLEVHPSMGIFRGCAGGDCATQLTFPYPNSPDEKVFFVYDLQDQLKGYITGNLVESNGKKSFQVSTISGPRISSNDAEMILEGLERIKKELNAEQLLLPPKEKLDELLNYDPVKSVYAEKVKDRPYVEVKYLDSKFRQKIETFRSDFNIGLYDKMAHNSKAIVYAKSEALSLSINVAKNPTPLMTKSKPTNEKMVVELAMDLINSGREGYAIRMFNAAKITEERQKEILDTIKNIRNLSIPEHQQQLKKILGFTEAEASNSISSLGRVYLNTTDYSSVVNKPEFIDSALRAFRGNAKNLYEKLSPAMIQTFIEKGDQQVLIQLVENIAGDSKAFKEKELKLLVKRAQIGSRGSLIKIISQLLSSPRAEGFENVIKETIQKAGTDELKALARQVFSRPHSAKMSDAFNLMMKMADEETKNILLKSPYAEVHMPKIKYQRINDCRSILRKLISIHEH